VIPEYVGTTMEKTSFRWPAALRRRFLSALYYRTRKTLASEPAQKSLEVRTPLVQNGPDEHGLVRGDNAVEGARIGRISPLHDRNRKLRQ
jgi:hypothetical protein